MLWSWCLFSTIETITKRNFFMAVYSTWIKNGKQTSFWNGFMSNLVFPYHKTSLSSIKELTHWYAQQIAWIAEPWHWVKEARFNLKLYGVWFLLYVVFCVFYLTYLCVHIAVHVWWVRAQCGNQFCFSSVWDLVIQLRLSGMVTGAFIWWAIMLHYVILKI